MKTTTTCDTCKYFQGLPLKNGVCYWHKLNDTDKEGNPIKFYLQRIASEKACAEHIKLDKRSVK